MAKLMSEMTETEREELVAKQVLDPEEQDWENHIRKAKDLKGMGAEQANAVWKRALDNTERKSPVTLRISEDVLKRIRLKAREEGLPYQTLINSLLHKYAHGRIKSLD